MNRDTIAAQATASGEGGVAIVRVSGEGCEHILGRVFRAKNGKPLENRRLTFGYVIDGETIIDEAMAVMMRAPFSYTREDVAEIHCHGSDALVRRILLLLLRAGARMAKPGEFTCGFSCRILTDSAREMQAIATKNRITANNSPRTRGGMGR